MAAVDSTAVFRARASAIGLDPTVLEALKNESLDSFARFSFCCNFSPGGADDGPLLRTLKRLNGGVDPSEASTSTFRRLFYESFSLSASELREKLDRTDDSAPRKIPVPEKNSRLVALQSRLGSAIPLEAEREPSDSLVDLVHSQYEENRLQWVPWDKLSKRDAEVSGSKKLDVFKPDASGVLKVSKEAVPVGANVSTDILMRFALRRRAVAYDLCNLVRYEIMETWHEILVATKLRDQVEGFAPVSTEQLIRADKYLFEVLARLTRAGIVPLAGGVRPLDDLWKSKMESPEVQLYLMPRQASSSKRVDPPSGELSNSQKKKAKKEAALARAAGTPKGKGKGKDKGRGKGSSPTMPAALQGGVPKMPDGKSLCFGYNLGTCPTTGAQCAKGLHRCCKHQCYSEDHIYIECPS